MSELELGPLRFGVVGAGRLGRVLGRALQSRGLELVAASSRSAAGRERATRELGVPTFESPVDVAADVDVLLLCVPDDAIGAVATTLAGSPPGGDAGSLRVVHTSGSVGLRALDPLRSVGCDVLAMHPLQTITGASTPADLVGAAAAVTAHDAAGTAFGHALAHALDLHPFDLPDDARGTYHAASSFAANFTVTLQGIVRDLAAAAHLHEGVARNAFCALARSAVDRVEREGPEAALTGPIARGDVGTVATHLEALERDAPHHLGTYRVLAQATTQLAVGAGSLDVETAHRIATMLASHPASEEEHSA